MSETDQPITQKQNSLIWQGLQIVRKLPGWMKAARDSGRVDVALFLRVDQTLKRR
jgi:hypothetical protein